MLDDSLRVHERGGAMLVESLHRPAVAGMRRQDLGEFMIHAGADLDCLCKIKPKWTDAYLSER